jgi:hypothetical protein
MAKTISFNSDELDILRNYYEQELEKAEQRLNGIKAIISKIGGQATSSTVSSDNSDILVPKLKGKRGRPAGAAKKVTKVTEDKSQRRKSKFTSFVIDYLQREGKFKDTHTIINSGIQELAVPASKEKTARATLQATLFRLSTEKLIQTERVKGIRTSFWASNSADNSTLAEASSKFKGEKPEPKVAVATKGKRGRPKLSSFVTSSPAKAITSATSGEPKKRMGRPKGSTNKVKETSNAKTIAPRAAKAPKVSKPKAVKAPKVVKAKAPKVVKAKAPKVVKAKAPKEVKAKAPKEAKAKAIKEVKAKAPKEVKVKTPAVAKTKAAKPAAIASTTIVAPKKEVKADKGVAKTAVNNKSKVSTAKSAPSASTKPSIKAKAEKKNPVKVVLSTPAKSVAKSAPVVKAKATPVAKKAVPVVKVAPVAKKASNTKMKATAAKTETTKNEGSSN